MRRVRMQEIAQPKSVSSPLYSYTYGATVAREKGYARFRQQLRLKKFLPFINPKSGEKILELGCNDGAFARHVSTYGADVLGIDINQEMITSLNDEHFMIMSATDLTFPDNTFDKIYSFEVIEHIPDIQKYLSEAHRVLKKNGQLILSFPWELIRGQAAIGNSLQIYHNLHYSRRLHVHKLSPKKIKEMTQDIPFVVRTSTICAIPFPSYVMVIEK
ncbi:class I SAM-dependent methyltransferase [Ktedonobacteria bacterium brp13]|nr:class I SAM-dependent methyltransferase [Ktedonobacteria bacterium brp13]